MATYVYSSCNPITTGCYLYTNACLTTAASTGKYSNGTNCYDVTSGGYVSAVYTCPSNLYINMQGPSSADYASSPGTAFVTGVQVVSQTINTYNSSSYFTTVASNLSISCTCYGMTNTVTSTFYINSGNSCSSGNSFYGFDSYETIDGYGVDVNGISPAEDNYYIYNSGSGFRDSYYYC